MSIGAGWVRLRQIWARIEPVDEGKMGESHFSGAAAYEMNILNSWVGGRASDFVRPAPSAIVDQRRSV